MKPTIRQLTAQDAAAYQRLRLQALQDSPTAFGSSYENEVDRTEAEIAARVTPAVDGSRCVFGAFAEVELVGFVAFIRRKGKKQHHCAELAGMYVAPAFRHGSFGRALINAVIAHAQSLGDIRQLKLGVNATNKGAQRLYQSAGFTRFGVEPDALYVDGMYYDEEHYLLLLVRQ